jgi:hypothetical protein
VKKKVAEWGWTLWFGLIQLGFVVAAICYLFHWIDTETMVVWFMLSLMTDLVELKRLMLKNPPVDVVLEMALTVDRPVRVIDVKTKLNGTEPTSGGRIGSPDATKVEEDREKMN